MSELIRRTPEEKERYFLNHILELQNEIKSLKAHAVEVLAEKCYYNNELWDENRDMSEWEDVDEHIRNRCRAEARASLGWEE